MEVKKLEQKWSAAAHKQILAGEISPDLMCEVRVETDQPVEGEKVKVSLFYGDRKKAVGVDMINKSGNAYFDVPVKKCGELPEEEKFRAELLTIAKPEPKPDDEEQPPADPVKDADADLKAKLDAKDQEGEEALRKAKLERERREREERKRARRAERDRGRDKGENPQKKDTPPPAETVVTSTPREKFLRLAGRSPNGMRGTHIAVLLYSKVDGAETPEPGEGIIFCDPRDRMEGAVTNRFGVADVTVPFAGSRMIYVTHASGSAALHVSVN